MTHIILNNVSVEYPVFNASARSFTNQVVSVATGGILNRNKDGGVSVSALSDLNLEFKSGDRVGVIGANGAGKSTFLRLVAGIYDPTSGTLDRNGKVGSLIDIGMGINPEATGRENIYLRAKLMGLSKSEIDGNYEEILAFAELGDFINLPVRTYSTGMHLRLAFSVATIIRPNILIMDEWLSVGDAAFVKKAENRLKSVIEASDILFLASHERHLLSSATNKVVWLEHGRLKDYGPTEEILAQYFKG